MYCKNFVNDLTEKIIEKNCQCCINLEKNCKVRNSASPLKQKQTQTKNKSNWVYIDKRVRDMIMRNTFDFEFKGDEDIFLSIAMCYLHENDMHGFFMAMEVLELHGQYDNNLLSDFCHVLKEHEKCITDTDWRVSQTRQMHEGLALFQAVPSHPRISSPSTSPKENKKENEKKVKDLTIKEWLEIFYSTYCPELCDKNIKIENPWQELDINFDDFVGIEGFQEVAFDDLPGDFRQGGDMFFENVQS